MQVLLKFFLANVFYAGINAIVGSQFFRFKK